MNFNAGVDFIHRNGKDYFSAWNDAWQCSEGQTTSVILDFDGLILTLQAQYDSTDSILAPIDESLVKDFEALSKVPALVVIVA